MTNGEETTLFLYDSIHSVPHRVGCSLVGNLPNGHGRGGQSAQRFQRMYLAALDAYNKRIVEKALESFRSEEGVSFLNKLIISGNGIRKKFLSDELRKFFPVIETFSYTSIDDLLGSVDISCVGYSEKKYTKIVMDILDTEPELLVFGDEVIRNFDSLKFIITCGRSADVEEMKESSKMIVFNERTSEYKWLQSFGGLIGVKYFATVAEEDTREEDTQEEDTQENLV